MQPDRNELVESSEQTPKPHTVAVGEVEGVVRPVIDAHGLELFDLSLHVERGGWVLRVIVDALRTSPSAHSVTVDHCAEVSRDLSTALDAADFMMDAYTLEVSSPGVERPLRGQSDYERFAGKLAKITLHEPIQGIGGVVRGTLACVKDDTLDLDVANQQRVSIPLSRIKRAKLVYELPTQSKKGSSKKKRRSNKGRRD